MKSFKDILSEKPKKNKKFSLDQINAALAKVGISPKLVMQAMNVLNAVRGLGFVEATDIADMQRKDMGKWLKTAFDKYNDLMEFMAKVNIRDDQISKEWKKVDKAFDNILKITNKKGYLK